MVKRLLAAPPARFQRSPALPLLVWITLSGTFPMHLFVPVLPQAAQDLGVSASKIQSAITIYLIGLSVGQLMLGPSSDRFGRRPVLITGFIIYVAGSVGAACAPNLTALLVARFMQAIGGCAGLVLGRAIARDIAGEAEAVRKIAVLSSMTNLGPGLAPLIGTQLALVLGWRGMLGTLAAASTVILLGVVLTMPETHRQRRRVHVTVYLASWRRLLANPRFLRFSLGGAVGTTSFYAFVANAPFIFHDRFGYSLRSVGFLYLLVVSCLTLGSLVASRFAGVVRPHLMVVLTALVMTIASAVALGVELAGATRPITYLPAIMALSAAIGICSPFAMTEAVNADPQSIGAASGLYGCLQMIAGAITVELVGHLPSGPIMATDIGLLAASSVTLIAFFLPIKSPHEAKPKNLTSEELESATVASKSPVTH